MMMIRHVIAVMMPAMMLQWHAVFSSTEMNANNKMHYQLASQVQVLYQVVP
jgi:hypothetical protein